jgi:hypothetical protein
LAGANESFGSEGKFAAFSYFLNSRCQIITALDHLAGNNDAPFILFLRIFEIKLARIKIALDIALPSD